MVGFRFCLFVGILLFVFWGQGLVIVFGGEFCVVGLSFICLVCLVLWFCSI